MIWLDALRLIAGVSMVGLHATADPNGQPFPDWDVGERIGPLLVRTVIYTARTELFLIISVFLLILALDRRPRSYAMTIAEQTRRLLVPFLFWTIFYAFFSLIKASQFGYFNALWSDLQQVETWLRYLVLGSSKYHMHFLPTLFGLILLYPIFRLAQKHPWLGVGIIACLVLKRELDGYLWANHMQAPWFSFALRTVKILTYAGYGLAAGAFVGIWQNHGKDKALQSWFGLIALFGVLLFAIKIAAMHKTLQLGAWPFGYTAGYWADFLFPVLLFAGCLVLAQRHWPAVISRVAKYSFGIYLCHPIFLDLVEIVIEPMMLTPMAQVSIKIAVAIAATTLLVWALERIRLLAWTVGLGPLPWPGTTRLATAGKQGTAQ